MSGIIETHCHLDYLKANSIQETLERAKIASVDTVITIAVEPDNQDIVLEIAHDHDNVFCTQGIHPHKAKDFTTAVRDKIKKNAASSKVVAIGEIGLDYYYDHSPRDVQIQTFRSQLDLAKELNKPVIIHTRDADQDMLAIIEEYQDFLRGNAVIHCFTSTLELAEKAVELGMYIGVNGIITFPKAENVRDVVIAIPIENILLETDAPFLAPKPYRGKENAPEYLPHVVKRLADLKSISEDEVVEITRKNSLKLFRLD